MSAFEGLIENLRIHLNSDKLKTLVEFEVILVDLVQSPDMHLSIENISRNYGVGSGKDNSPFRDQLTIDTVRVEMSLMRDEWRKLKGDAVSKRLDET